MKVVQCTVSNAPGGSPLKDVNAKNKVTARAKIYSIPAGKIENPIIPTAVADPKFTSPSQSTRNNIKKI